jgi:uncharacterized membrane protein
MSEAITPYLNNFFEVIINPFITLLFLLSFVLFAWGILLMMVNPANEEKRSQGKQHMLWGVVGMVIMLGSYGIIQLLGGTVAELFK